MIHNIIDLGSYYSLRLDELWNIVNAHKNTLEYLDLYPTYPSSGSPEMRNLQSPVSSLRDFPALHTVRIAPETLIGCAHQFRNTSLHLSDSLPKGLKSLTLYGYTRMDTKPAFDQQM